VVVNRRRFQRALDTIVRNNRVTLAVTFPLVGVVLFRLGVGGYLPDWLAFNPYLMVLATAIMALPLVSGIAPLVDRRAATGLAVLALFSWGIELLGVRTGWPYGEFHYQLELGPMLFGDVPLALPVFYFPILLNSYLCALLFLGKRGSTLAVRFPAVLAVVLVLDLILDPGAVAVGFWSYAESATAGYYGVPVQNFLGWVLSGSVAVGIVHVSFDHDAIVDRLQHCGYFLDDLINFLLFWGLINALFGQLVPVVLSTILLVGLFRADWFDFAGLGTGRQVVDQ
jgi:putative membrane protein